ncbi:MAG TPA: hypothetical protein DG754_05455 [Bacteroidales bacterium]|jgi:hypothetical protein|nr:hypothetical protein [Bacteroidales bacterium]
METLKLLLLTLGVLAIIVAFFILTFTLLGSKNQNNDQESCSTDNSPRSFGCGCGSGACGLPASRGNVD